jgi:hypothetical protein
MGTKGDEKKYVMNVLFSLSSFIYFGSIQRQKERKK